MNSDLRFFPDAIFEKILWLSQGRRRLYEKEVQVENNLSEAVSLAYPGGEPWIDVYYFGTPRPLEIQPGEKARFVIRVDDQSPFFPAEGPVNAAVALECTQASGRVLSTEIPICFETVSPAPTYDGIFAIDFGTTNSSCAVIDPGSFVTRHLELEPGQDQPAVGSAIWFESVQPKDSPKYYIGVDALARIMDAGTKSDSYVFSSKRFLGMGEKHTIQNRHNLQPGADRFVTYTHDEICRFVVEKLLNRAESALDHHLINKVVVTYPAMFSQARVRALRRIFVEDLGLEPGNVQMSLDEASAAALWFVEKLILDRAGDINQLMAEYTEPFTILAYDFGGGTIDISLVKVSLKRNNSPADARFTIAVEILGCGGDPKYGGDNVTLEVFKVLKWRLAKWIAIQNPDEEIAADPNRAHEIEGARARIRENSGAIDLAISNGRDVTPEMAKDINILVPTRFEGLQGEDEELARALFFSLWFEAEELKKQLSVKASRNEWDAVGLEALNTDLLRTVEIDDVGIDEVCLTMEELETRIREPIWRTMQQASGLFQRIATEQRRCPDFIRHVILAGQSSALPIVRRLIEEVLQVDNNNISFDLETAKSSVAIGACLAANLGEGPAEYRFDVKTLINSVPHDIGYLRKGAQNARQMERVFELGASLPQTETYKNFGGRLQLFSQAGSSDDPIYLGMFDFESEGESARPAVAAAPAPQAPAPPPPQQAPKKRGLWGRWKREKEADAMEAGADEMPAQQPVRQMQKPRPKPAPKDGSVTLHYSEDREMFATRGEQRWNLIKPNLSEQGTATTMFSGEH